MTDPVERRDSGRAGVSTRRYAFLLTVAGLVTGTDQAIKAVVRATLPDHPRDVLGGLVRLDYTRNTGAAFGIYQTGGFTFAIIAILVSAGILVYYRRISRSHLTIRLALGLVLGGAVGNLIDRIRLGYVIDFIDLRWWPVFNLADSAIVIGVALLAASTLFDDPDADRG